MFNEKFISLFFRDRNFGNQEYEQRKFMHAKILVERLMLSKDVITKTSDAILYQSFFTPGK